MEKATWDDRLPVHAYTFAREDELISFALLGDTDAYAELSGRHSRQLFRSIFRIVRNIEDAEDILQESLMKGFTHLATFNKLSAFSTWLTRIGINRALMHLRRQRNGINGLLIVRGESEEDIICDLRAETPSPEELLCRTELSNALARAIGCLPVPLREVVASRCYHDASVREIATAKGLTEPAVKARLHRARSRLRQTMLRQPTH